MSTSSSNAMDASPSGKCPRIVEEVALRHGRALRSIARRLTGDRDEASDLVQDTLERALCCGGGLASQALYAWMVAVMRNLFIDRCRQRRVRLRCLHAFYWCGWESFLEPDAPDETLPTSSSLTYDDVTEALLKLAPPFREVFELSARNLSLSQIGAVLGIPAATAGTRLFRARRKLRAILAPQDPSGRMLDSAIPARW
jgi:RNA polymerase sigma-70 factor (ECF subfamily)